MFVVDTYASAVFLCVLTMLCWDSWGNTQKLTAKSWRYECFYWDYTLGVLLFSILSGFTLGSIGDNGRSFLPDLCQADRNNLLSAFIGGVVFNASNILLSAAISICGMSVAFPVGVGLALVLGVLINYFTLAKGEPLFLFIGVALIVVAILLNALAYRKARTGVHKVPLKGIWIAIVAGVIMSFFYRTSYTAVFLFSLGVFGSNFLFNTLAMKYPVNDVPISISQYFKGRFPTHLVGIAGGVIWCIGQTFSLIASEKAGSAISYGLGQGATLVSALWGILVWKEFKGCPRISVWLNIGMFVLFIGGLALLIYAGA